MNLYYNAFHPCEILSSLTIKVSVCCGRARGVSMSSQMIDSHGPFTFKFVENTPWYGELNPVQYGKFDQIDFLHKQLMFEGEYEWWSKYPIQFNLADIDSIIFRSNSAGAKIFPRKSKRIAKIVNELFPYLYQEM